MWKRVCHSLLASGDRDGSWTSHYRPAATTATVQPYTCNATNDVGCYAECLAQWEDAFECISLSGRSSRGEVTASMRASAVDRIAVSRGIGLCERSSLGIRQARKVAITQTVVELEVFIDAVGGQTIIVARARWNINLLSIDKWFLWPSRCSIYWKDPDQTRK